MKGFRGIPRILKINTVEGYKVSCLFSNGESRIIDFEDFFKNVIKASDSHPAYILLKDINEFCQLKILGHTIGWENTGLTLENFEGEEEFYYFDLDPIVLYDNSTSDESRNIHLGQIIKTARKKAGLTQEELAKKSGTSKHYISRIENNKSDIELMTLKKIIEAGLGKELLIEIN